MSKSSWKPRTDVSLFVLSALVLITALAARPLLPEAVGTAKATGISKAAKAVLESLDAEQRKRASYEFDDPQRFNWHFTPLVDDKARTGQPIGALDADQKKTVHELLKTALSDAGYERVEQIRELEAILAKIEGERPNRPWRRDPGLYYVWVFGEPGSAEWGWRFEGHHLSLNYTLEEDRVVSVTPLFFGANPAKVPSGPKKGLRVLAKIEDLPRQLMKSLSAEQLAVALGKEKPIELTSMQKRRYEGPLPTGLSASELTKKQVALIEGLIAEFLRTQRDEVAEAIRERIAKSGIERMQIAWRGSIEPGEPHSYLIHGPEFVIGYANFQNDANHIHAGFRLLDDDFGGD